MEFGIAVDLVEGHGGIFQVIVNGKTVFDKAGIPGKPNPPVDEIIAYIRRRIG